MVSYFKLKAYRESIGAPWFTDPWDLNLIVARSGFVGFWDDLIILAFTDSAGRQVVESYPATGDAWQGEWLRPTHPEGCIYVLDQHVKGGLELGLFKGRPALRQRRPFKYVRWPRNKGHVPSVEELDVLSSFIGTQGTHIHNRVSGNTPEKPATDDSEGCTVALYQHHWASVINLVEEQEKRLGSAIISPTYCKLEHLK